MESLIWSYKDLVEGIALGMNGEIDIRDISVSPDFSCVIKLEGPSWDGAVDKRVASFVLNLQGAVNKVHKELLLKSIPADYPRFPAPKVRVYVGKGCSLISVPVDSILKFDVSTLPEDMKMWTYIIGASAVVFVLLGYRIVDAIRDVKIKTKDEQTKALLAQAQIEALKVQKDIVYPMISLIGSMRKGDMLHFPEANKVYSKEEAFKHFSFEQEVKEETFYVDDNYDLSVANLKKHGIQLEKENGNRIFAFTKLIPNGLRKEIYKKVEHAGTEQNVPRLDLQVNVVVADGNREAYIVGIGPKRHGAMTLQEFNKITRPDSLEEKQSGQYSLI